MVPKELEGREEEGNWSKSKVPSLPGALAQPICCVPCPLFVLGLIILSPQLQQAGEGRKIVGQWLPLSLQRTWTDKTGRCCVGCWSACLWFWWLQHWPACPFLSHWGDHAAGAKVWMSLTVCCSYWMYLINLWPFRNSSFGWLCFLLHVICVCLLPYYWPVLLDFLVHTLIWRHLILQSTNFVENKSTLLVWLVLLIW